MGIFPPTVLIILLSSVLISAEEDWEPNLSFGDYLGFNNKAEAKRDRDNLKILPVINLTRHSDVSLGDWATANLDFTCESVDKTEIHSLVLIPCDAIDKCQTRLDCLDQRGMKCITSAFSYSSKILLGGKCKEIESKTGNIPLHPLRIVGASRRKRFVSKRNSNSNYSNCLSVSPSDDGLEEDFSGVVECVSGHFQKKLWFFNYKADRARFLSLDSPAAEIMNMTIARYPVINGELTHQIFLSSSAQNNIHQIEKIYADTAVFVECKLEPFFFGEDADEEIQIILTSRNGSTVNFTRTEDELSAYIKGTKIRVFPDLVSISCQAGLLNGTVVKVSLNLTVTLPPLNLTVPAFPKSSSSKGPSKLIIDQKMGCKFSGTKEKIEENREILRNMSAGVRKNVVRSVLTFLRFRDHATDKFNCEPLENYSHGPFHFLLDFVPSPPKINKTIESQGHLEEYYQNWNISSEVNQDGETVLRFRVRSKPDIKGTVNVMKLPILRCRYHGDPKPHGIWMDNSMTLLHTVGVFDPDVQTDERLKNEIAYLDLGQLESNERFQVNYSCVMENYLGKDILNFIVESVAFVDEVHEQEMAEIKAGFGGLVDFLSAKFENETRILLKTQEAQHGTPPDFHTDSSASHSYFFLLLLVLLVLLGMNLAVCLEVFLPQWRNLGYKIQRPIRKFCCFSCAGSKSRRSNSTAHLNLGMELQDENVV